MTVGEVVEQFLKAPQDLTCYVPNETGLERLIDVFIHDHVCLGKIMILSNEDTMIYKD